MVVVDGNYCLESASLVHKVSLDTPGLLDWLVLSCVREAEAGGGQCSGEKEREAFV